MLVLVTSYLCTYPAVKQPGRASQELGAKHLVSNPYFQRRSHPTKSETHQDTSFVSRRFPERHQEVAHKQSSSCQGFSCSVSPPPRHVVSAAHSSMGTFLTNHHKMMAEFSWDTPLPCSCSSFREKHPNIGGVNHPEDGRWHVASPLDALHVSKRLRFLLGTSAKTQVCPALSSYIEETWAEVQRWAQRHSVPNVNYEDWRNFVRDQWSQHVVSSRTPLSFDDIKYIKSVLTGFVVQGRDHAPNHLHIFCPLLYWRILKSTFGGEEVYTRSLLTPNQAQDFLATMTRKSWLKPYRWGVQEAAKLPCSYLLLKQKKNFLKARPIISYKS